MSFGLYNKGGQKRTIDASCGWRRTGNPSEVNKLYCIHQKVCSDCRTQKLNTSFDKTSGRINGWGNDYKHSEVKVNSYINGHRMDYKVKASTTAKALDKVYDIVREEDIDDIMKWIDTKDNTKDKNKK